MVPFKMDNNDSFTYNIVDGLRKIGYYRLDVIETKELTLLKVRTYDKLILSPGPGLPEDYPPLFDVLDAFHETKPILGICLGLQAIGLYFSGRLFNLNPVVHGQAALLKTIKPTPLFNGLPPQFHVGLYHSWALAPDPFPNDLEIIAQSEAGIIMAIQLKNRPVFGLQFHPESHITEHGLAILKNFVHLK
jgi:anthranilate synthase/aminodeoxychorismate synthase-like glutamine amidotransferase